MITEQPTDVHGRPYARWPLFITLLLATLAGSLMQSTLGTALPTLMDKFDINLNTAQQATTWFLLAMAVVIPVSAFLIKRIPTKRLTIGIFTVLAVGIAISAFTPEKHSMWWLFLVGRVVAALAAGLMMALLQIIILNIFSSKERSVAMGLFGLVVGMSPAIGPTLTGWILDKKHHLLGLTIPAHWQVIFYIPLIVVVACLVIMPFVMRDVIETEDDLKLDWWSFILSCFGFGTFLLGFTNFATDGWDDFTNVDLPILIGVVLITIFVRRQLKLEKPFLDVRVFKNWDFSVATVGMIMATMAMMGVEMMLPTYLQNVHGMSTLDSGLTLLPGALLMGVLSPIAGALYAKAGAKRLALGGFTVLAAGTLPFAFLSATTPAVIITTMYGLRMAGIAMVLMPLVTAAMDSLPTKYATDGTAVSNTTRQLASSVGVALLTSITQNVITNNKPGHALKTQNPLLYADKVINASMDGFKTAFAVGLAFAVIGLVVMLFFKSKAKKEVA